MHIPCQTFKKVPGGNSPTNWEDSPNWVERIAPVRGANRPSGWSESSHYLRGGGGRFAPPAPRPRGSPSRPLPHWPGEVRAAERPHRQHQTRARRLARRGGILQQSPGNPVYGNARENKHPPNVRARVYPFFALKIHVSPVRFRPYPLPISGSLTPRGIRSSRRRVKKPSRVG